MERVNFSFESYISDRRTGPVSLRGAKYYCPNIFLHRLPEKSSGFAWILLDILPEKGYLKAILGGPPRMPM